ncbi:MAG: family 16 glycosylhydrolase, partial [Lachnospiraceae bacterium]|nr:family 16 glycosylhydrolase [Lachnospiraceae bacterium]
SYTSGKVNSQNKKDFLYGKVCIRAKVPEGQGLWPAAWMMPTDEGKYGQWPKCGEIDIMEVLGNDTKTSYATIHYGEPHGQEQGKKELTEGSFSDDFHEYSVEWEPGKMKFFVDFVQILEVRDWFTAVEGEDEKPYPAPFDQTFFVQMNLAVGGDWPGNPDETTDFDNAEYLIDYVRVYQKDHYKTDVKKPVIEMREPLEDGNYVRNGDFADESESLEDDQDWKFLLAQNGKGEAVIKDGMIEITSEAEGDVDYSVQLVSWNIPIKKGSKYKITFDAKAEEPRNIVVCVSAPFVNWIRYFPDTELEISDKWETYTYEFEMNDKTDPRGRLEFNLGHRGSTATVDITNVRVEEIE